MSNVLKAKSLIGIVAGLVSVGALAAKDGFGFPDIKYVPAAIEQLNKLTQLDVPGIVQEIKLGELDAAERQELEEEFKSQLVLPASLATLESKMEAVFGLVLRAHSVVSEGVALVGDAVKLFAPVEPVEPEPVQA